MKVLTLLKHTDAEIPKVTENTATALAYEIATQLHEEQNQLFIDFFGGTDVINLGKSILHQIKRDKKESATPEQMQAQSLGILPNTAAIIKENSFGIPTNIFFAATREMNGNTYAVEYVIGSRNFSNIQDFDQIDFDEYTLRVSYFPPGSVFEINETIKLFELSVTYGGSFPKIEVVIPDQRFMLTESLNAKNVPAIYSTTNNTAARITTYHEYDPTQNSYIRQRESQYAYEGASYTTHSIVGPSEIPKALDSSFFRLRNFLPTLV